MTEDEYRTLKAFAELPLFDDDDDRCETLEKPTADKYDTIETTMEYELASAYETRDDIEPRGAVRHFDEDGNTGIEVVYWRFRGR